MSRRGTQRKERCGGEGWVGGGGVFSQHKGEGRFQQTRKLCFKKQIKTIQKGKGGDKKENGAWVGSNKDTREVD